MASTTIPLKGLLLDQPAAERRIIPLAVHGDYQQDAASFADIGEAGQQQQSHLVVRLQVRRAAERWHDHVGLYEVSFEDAVYTFVGRETRIHLKESLMDA